MKPISKCLELGATEILKQSHLTRKEAGSEAKKLLLENVAGFGSGSSGNASPNFSMGWKFECFDEEKLIGLFFVFGFFSPWSKLETLSVLTLLILSSALQHSPSH